MTEKFSSKKRDALNRLKTVRGHLDGIIRMLEDDTYCVDVMKQISAAQSSLERANRVLFRNHLETCFAHAVLDGRAAEAVDELADAVKFDSAFTGPSASLSGAAVGEVDTSGWHEGGAHDRKSAYPRGQRSEHESQEA